MRTAQFDLHASLEERHWWFVARRRILQSLVQDVLPPGKEKKAVVVDVGCGTGANVAALSEDYECVGIDTSEDAIRHARERYKQVRFVCGMAPADLGEVAQGADLFVLTDVIEHVSDDFLFLSSLLATAKPGAFFLITVPAHQSLWSAHDVSFGHYRRYDQARLAAVWEGLPVTPLLVSYYNARLYPVVKTLRTLGRLRGRAWGGADTDFTLPAPPVNRSLTRLFAGERRVLLDLLARRRTSGYRTGVSLIALLRRESGTITVRGRPDHVAPDEQEPEQSHAH